MSSTFLELCQLMRQECGVGGSGPSAVTGQTGMLAKLVSWVAAADMDICTKYLDWGFLHSEHSVPTVAGTKDVSAPSDFGMWDEESFYLNRTTDQYQKLTPVDYFEWRDAYRNGVKTNAKPTMVIIKPNKDLILEPPPDIEYTLTADYYKTATKMTANTSVSLIPTKFDRLIIARAKMWYAEHENAPEVMQGAVVEYKELMGRLESLYLRGQEPNTMGHSHMVIVPE